MTKKKKSLVEWVTELPLSKELWEKGLKIETEKWWAIHLKRKLEYIIRCDELIHYGGVVNNCFGWEMYPAYSTDELLAVMPGEIEDNGNYCELTIHKGTRYKVFYHGLGSGDMVQKELDLPEALGKMILWLLSNGYILKSGELVKGHKINLGRKCSQKTKEKKGL